MTVVQVTEDCPRRRRQKKGVTPGQLLNLPESNALVWKRRGWAVEPEKRVETATRGPSENAAKRTTAPEPKYTGRGWWQLPDGRKVRGPKDADPQELMED